MSFSDNFIYETKSKNKVILKLFCKLNKIKIIGKVIFRKIKTWTYQLMECQIMICQVVICLAVISQQITK
jgi:hypothetical protein